MAACAEAARRDCDKGVAPSGRALQPDAGIKVPVTAANTAPVRNQWAVWSWSSTFISISTAAVVAEASACLCEFIHTEFGTHDAIVDGVPVLGRGRGVESMNQGAQGGR